jgi:uncharacterized caspase-like protein
MNTARWLVWGLWLFSGTAFAQFMGPPPFATGIPGQFQMQAIEQQRHQARTLLYREALEEIRRNPTVVDVRECSADDPSDGLCLPPAVITGVPAEVRDQPVARRFALLVGNNQYQSPIPRLETPRRDVSAIARTLRQSLGYSVRVAEDARKEDIVRAVAELAREVGPADSVFFYYAGHGYLMDDTGMGYWIPVDGSVKTAKQWLSNTDIAKLLRAIPARQVIVVSDSCFSGTLTSEHSVSSRAAGAGEVLRRRSVMALSSGGEEPVSDEGRDGHSVFAWHFLQAIAAVDATTQGFELFQGVRRGVESDYPQTPQYGAVLSAGHEAGGEYLFQARP